MDIKMDKILLYKKAYRYLENLTPLKIDCGTLCNSACCSGSTDSGMLLFPEEEMLLSQENDWYTIIERDNLKLLVCNGHCPREHRPLACRIFPLLPYLNSDRATDFELQMDYRGNSVCPLVQHSSPKELDRFFHRKVQYLFNLLLQDSDIKKFVKMLSTEQDGIRRLIDG